MTKWVPWHHYSGLMFDRLAIVAGILADARDGAVDDHHAQKGETSWTLGVSAYERSEVALIVASHKYSWLRVIHGKGGGPVMFVIAIGAHPMRFYHGTPDDIPTKYETAVFPELAEIEQALKFDASLSEDRILRLSVATGGDLRVTDVELVELNEKTGELLNRFSILVPGANRSAAPIVPFTTTPPMPKPVSVPAPVVRIKGQKKKKDAE